MKSAVNFDNLYLELSSTQKDIVQPFLKPIWDNLDIEIKTDIIVISSNSKSLSKCPFEIVLHRIEKKISFYIYNETLILNYEDYEVDSDFRDWIIKSIKSFLTSNILIKNFSLNGKTKKRKVYVERYNTGEFDYPINETQAFVFFWQKKKLKIDEKKYEPWIKQYYNSTD